MHPLNKLNQDFYVKIAHSFNQTRQQPWVGWAEALPHIHKALVSTTNPTIFDIGCGNGRFAQFLAEEINPERIKNTQFLGFDTDETLLSYASSLQLPFSTKWTQKDVMEKPWEINTQAEVIGIFGVIHHLPTAAIRNSFFAEIYNHLATNGVAIIAAWRLDRSKRFVKSVVSTTSQEMKETAEKYNFSITDLAKNDYLLDWDKGQHAIRFVHIFEDEELAKLCKDNKLSIIDSYDADGKEGNLNKYIIVKKAL